MIISFKIAFCKPTHQEYKLIEKISGSNYLYGKSSAPIAVKLFTAAILKCS